MLVAIIIIYILLGVIGTVAIVLDMVRDDPEEYEKFNLLEIILFVLTAIIGGWTLLIIYVFNNFENFIHKIDMIDEKMQRSNNWFVKILTKRIFF